MSRSSESAPVVMPAPPGLARSGALNTPAMWVYSLIQILDVGVLIAITAVAAVLVRTGDPVLTEIGLAIDSPVALIGVNVLALAARLLLARADHRALARLGVPQPMPWGWGLMAPVYTIGRGVVLHRRTGGGTMLTWIGLAVLVLALVVDRSGIYDQVAVLVLG